MSRRQPAGRSLGSQKRVVQSAWLIRWAMLSGLLFLLSACDQAPPPLKLQIGQNLPTLAVQDLFNQPARIEPVANQLLMINVWATWCGPCRHELPSLQRLAGKLGADRLRLVGLSVDMDEHVVREYLIENKIDFPSFLDRDQSEVNGVLGVRVFPSTFFIGPDGKLLKVIEGWREWDDPQLQAEIAALLPAVAGS